MIQISLFVALRRILPIALLLPLAAASAPLPLSQLYEPQSLSLPRVSPDGKRIALRAEIDGVQYLAMMDATTQQLELVGKFETTAVHNIFWKSDTQLLLIVGNREGTASEFRAFDLQTKKVAYLADNFSFTRAWLLSSLNDQPDEVVMQIESVNGIYLTRLNIRTGKLKIIEKPSSSIGNWIVDHDGNPIAAIAYENKRRYLQWRKDASSPWTRQELGPSNKPGLHPFTVHSDKRRLLAWDLAGPGPISLVALDPATLEREVIFAHDYADIDIESNRYWAADPSALFAIRYVAERPGLHFLSPEAAQLQAAIDKALPDTFNDIVSTSADHSVLAIVAASDRNPGINFVFNRRTGRLAAFGPTYQNINPAEMGSSRAFAFKSTDGLTVHGRLLLPPGKPGKPPLLVAIGPAANGLRSDYFFNPADQIFATRGYAVARIDYRGTPGYGRAFLAAGDYQFATGMPQDINQGVAYLIEQGWVDGDRVGLVTSGFGAFVGMPTLAGSDRYKVWINDGSLLSGVYLDYINPAFSQQDDDVDNRTVKNYRETINARTMLPKITTPSFHLYQQSGSRSLGESAETIDDYLKTPKDRREFAGFDSPAGEKPPHKEALKAREKMFIFLQRWLLDPKAK